MNLKVCKVHQSPEERATNIVQNYLIYKSNQWIIRNYVQIKAITKCTDLDLFIEIKFTFCQNLFLIAVSYKIYLQTFFLSFLNANEF